MQNKPIFFDCDLGRFQLVVTTIAERIASGRFSCDFCDFLTDYGCTAIEYGCDCADWDAIVKERDEFASCFWRKVLPTSPSAKTPRTECGTIGKEVI